MISWAWILTGVAIALAIYYYFVSILRVFEKTGVPYLKPTLIFGNFGPVVFKRRSVGDQVKFLYDSFPDAKYIGFHDFMMPTIMLRDLEIIKYVTVRHFDNFPNHKPIVNEKLDPFFGKNLFSLQDEKWREMRAVLSPTFTSSRIKGMFQLVSDCGTKFAENLVEKSGEVELKDNFTRYTMDVIASVAFGLTVDSLKNPNNEFYRMGREATTFGYLQSMKFFMFKVAPKLMSLFRFRVISLKIVNFFTDIVTATVKAREAGGLLRNDMIQLMIDARKSGKVSNLTMEEMTAHAFIFFFGGFDTTSSAMAFTAYEIAINQDVQTKLHREVDEVMAKYEGKVTFEALQGMHYLEAVVMEALRKYPPVMFTDRLCNKTIQIPPAVTGGPPFTAKPGTNFWIPYYGLHNDPRFFEDPKKFDPERFIDPETGKNREPEGYLAFGIGPRFCIGQRFAFMEVKLAIFHLMVKCKLEPCSKSRLPIVMSKDSFNLAPEGDYWVKVTPRTENN